MCRVEACETTRIEGHGLCMAHYKRWRRRGDPLVVTYMRGRSLVERFWARVNKTETCWLWTGAPDRNGYGAIYENGARGKHHYPHQISYEIHYGSRGELDVLHWCDTPACVRPEHLHLGTHADNMREMVERGRSKACGNWRKAREGRTQP